jgi:hypothetical protein
MPISYKPTPEVQVVMNMDGWGTQTLKTGIYRQVVASEPVQFTGIKLFYKNDLKAPVDWNAYARSNP